MNFSNLVYYVAQYKYKNDLDFSTYIKTIISKIEISENEILKFKTRNSSMIENNLENNVSKIKIYENKFLNSYIKFYFDLNNFYEKELTNYNNSYEHMLGIIKNNEDKKNFVCTLLIDIK